MRVLSPAERSAVPYYSKFGTTQLWAALPALLARPVATVSGVSQVYLVGDVGSDIFNRVDDALRNSALALEVGRRAPFYGPLAGIEETRRVLLESWEAVRESLNTAIIEGFTTAGDVLVVLATRIAFAVYALNRGFGAAFRAFWGVPPAAIPLAALALVLAVLGFGAVALLNPAIQAQLIAAVATGWTWTKTAAPTVFKALL